jgi:SAM-dependent methyltransferase
MPSSVRAYFDRRSGYWDEVYAARSLDGAIYRDRLERTLAWVRALHPGPGARALDAGCGAGLAAVALAEAGLTVEAMDVSPAMLAATARHAASLGLAERVHTAPGDVRELPHADGAFDLVIALGLIPWVADPASVVEHLSRVVRPGGHLVLSADHRRALPLVLDPYRPLRALRQRLLGTRARPAAAPPSARHSRAEVDAWLRRAGLVTVAAATVGFGPFTLDGRKLLAEARSVALHRTLQRWADGGLVGLKHLGWHYLVLARKPAAEERS